MPARPRTAAAVLAIVALGLGTFGCGDDDSATTAAETTQVTDQEPSDGDADRDRDRDRDRDQLRTAVADIAAACQGDPDRLDGMVTEQQRDQLRDRLRDESCVLDDEAELDIEDDDVTIDDDTATVRAAMRHRNRGDQDERELTWRFRWTEEQGWLLDDLDVLFEE